MFAMQLPLSAVRSGEVTAAMRENLITDNGISYIQVHPVFLYESLWCLLLLLIFLVIRRRKRFQGELFMRYLAGYGLGRFFFEWLRSDSLCIPGTKIPAAMVISAALFLIFTPVIWIKRVMSQKRAIARRRRREKVYEAEERIYGEKETTDPSKAAEPSDNAPVDHSSSDQNPPDPATAEISASRAGAETAPNPQEISGESENPTEASEQSDAQLPYEDNDDWENSQYAHISDTWRTPSEASAEEASPGENPFSPEAFKRPGENQS